MRLDKSDNDVYTVEHVLSFGLYKYIYVYTYSWLVRMGEPTQHG